MSGLIAVPGEEASDREVLKFALTFNGYEGAGGVGEAQDLGNDWLRRYEASGSLPDDLHTLRVILFVEQRRDYWTRWGSETRGIDYMRAITRKIRSVSGGSVADEGDWLRGTS